jgi:hypothetical protein
MLHSATGTGVPQVVESRHLLTPLRAFQSRTAILYLVAIWLSAMLTYDYYARIENPQQQQRISLHHEIVVRTAPYQYRYRILVPNAAEVIGRLIQRLPLIRSRPAVEPLTYSKRAFGISYCLLNFTALLIFFVCQIRLIWLFFAYELALLGGAISALLVDFTFRDHFFHPWSLWEGAFFALGLILIHRRMHWEFLGLSLVALLNRETSLFLVLIFLICTLPRHWPKGGLTKVALQGDTQFAMANLVVWLSGYLALHRLVGYRPSTFFIETALSGNGAHFRYAVALNVLLIGSLAPLILTGLRSAPQLIRRSAWILPAYFGLLLVIGFWWEIRYWIAVLPVIVPALIAAIANAGKVISSDHGI